jgi:hypothetical protein
MPFDLIAIQILSASAWQQGNGTPARKYSRLNRETFKLHPRVISEQHVHSRGWTDPLGAQNRGSAVLQAGRREGA